MPGHTRPPLHLLVDFDLEDDESQLWVGDFEGGRVSVVHDLRKYEVVFQVESVHLVVVLVDRVSADVHFQVEVLVLQDLLVHQLDAYQVYFEDLYHVDHFRHLHPHVLRLQDVSSSLSSVLLKEYLVYQNGLVWRLHIQSHYLGPRQPVQHRVVVSTADVESRWVHAN